MTENPKLLRLSHDDSRVNNLRTRVSVLPYRASRWDCRGLTTTDFFATYGDN